MSAKLEDGNIRAILQIFGQWIIIMVIVVIIIIFNYNHTDECLSYYNIIIA